MNSVGQLKSRSSFLSVDNSRGHHHFKKKRGVLNDVRRVVMAR